MKDIVFEHVSKAYGKTRILQDLNFRIEPGERLILLGASGCGKSTTLRLVAGLEQITSGSLYMGGQCVNSCPSGKRNVSMVFQNYALFPHMTVAENIVYGLYVKKLPDDEIRTRLAAALHMLHLDGLENRKPRDLSGGQRQRVALARAVVKRSDVLLLDEPLSNLDAQLRVHARKELVRVHEEYGQTFVYVTHDQVEAMTVGNRIAIMHDGAVEMLDTPYNVYHRPVNVFTARFIGSPSMNIFPLVLAEQAACIGDQLICLPEEWRDYLAAVGGKAFYLGIRPEDLRIVAGEAGNTLAVRVKYVEVYGKMNGVYFDLAGHEGVVLTPLENIQPGMTLYVSLAAGELHIFDQATENNIGYPEVYADVVDQYQSV